MSIHLSGSGVDHVKHMEVEGDMENSWVMFDHVKRLKDWTTLACHVYASKYRKVFTIAQTFFWKNLNSVMIENGVSNVNFKGFMADIAEANWNAIRQIYGGGDQVCQ